MKREPVSQQLIVPYRFIDLVPIDLDLVPMAPTTQAPPSYLSVSIPPPEYTIMQKESN